MVIDASALLAVLFKEPDRDRLVAALCADDVRLVSSVTALEASLGVLERKGEAGQRELDLLLHAAQVDVVPFTAAHLALARDAHQRFGPGRHEAALTLADCCAHALSKHSGEPLLFAGERFLLTDVETARSA